MATWLRLGLMIVSQIVVTPVFLSYWSAEQYGIWLAIFAVMEILRIPGMAHQSYVSNELLRQVNLDDAKFTRILKSGIAVGFIYGILEFTAAFCFAFFIPPSLWSNSVPEPFLGEARIAFVVMAAGSGILWNWGALWGRAGNALGYYARGAWWGIVDIMIRIVAPLAVIPFGAGIATAALATAVPTLVLHSICIRDLRRRVLPFIQPDVPAEWRLGWMNFLRSLALSLRSLLDMTRTTGTRLILVPLAGIAELAAFATMRTGANAALQGLGTITNPLLPELMRFLNIRDQEKSETAFSTVWMALLLAMVPGVVMLQAVAPPLFALWTRGKIPFDPVLFGMLSLGVLVFATAQPASAIATGNNLVRQLFLISLLASLITVGGIVTLVPAWGLRGAGASLLLAEITAACAFVRSSARWLALKGMAWPMRLFSVVVTSVALSAVAIFCISLWPKWNPVWLALFLAIQCLLVWHYWRQLPGIARSRIFLILRKILPSSLLPKSQSLDVS